MGSIRCAEEVLKAADISSDIVAECIGPLVELQHVRTTLVAHAAGSKAHRLRASLIRTYGSPYAHVNDLCGRLADSLRVLDGFCSQQT